MSLTTIVLLSTSNRSMPAMRHSWPCTAGSRARIWGGIHYRSATEVGAEMGRRVGELAAARLREEP